MLEVQNGSDAEMMIKEIKKAIHKWNHLLKNELSFKMITIQPNENNPLEE